MCETRISSLLGKITILVMVSLCVNTAVALDGSGTEEDPWLIQSLADFDEFAAVDNYWEDYTRLETDVNLAGRIYPTAVIAPQPDTAFTGVFDGNDHKIINLTIDSGVIYLGLFGYIDTGEVRNLGIEDGSISGDDLIGGLVGWNVAGDISNCYSTGFVSGQSLVGGLVGLNDGSVSNSCSSGNVSGDLTIGGLLGANRGSVSGCYSTADVTGDIGSRNYGGLVGKNLSLVSDCYSTGNVSGDMDVGGLLGDNEEGNVSNCYSIGSVGSVSSYGSVGGLVGVNEFGSLSNCFWDTDTQTHGVTESIGQNTGGTVVNVSGLPTYQLHQQSTFTDWDFINVWNIGENQAYPYLRVYLAGDINKDGIVNFFDFAIAADQWMEEE